MIELDGSWGEGGGQILRTALSLSSVTAKPCIVHNIRAGRSRPGLQPQHLACVRAAAQLVRAKLSGDAVGSTFLQFVPTQSVRAGDYRFEIGTAGSAALVLHTVAVPLASAENGSVVEISGGTHTANAPTTCDLLLAWAPAMAHFGIDAEISAVSLGFAPKGGGELRVNIAGGTVLRGARFISPEAVHSATASICTANLPQHVGTRGADEIRRRLGRRLSVEVDIRMEAALSTGAAVTVGVETAEAMASYHAIGERGKPMETVCQEACVPLLNWLKTGCSVDERLADQLVLPACLAEGETEFTVPRLSQHLQTVVWVARQFVDLDVSFEEQPGSGHRVLLRKR
jgi:RNA 3'-terminal phosphate cyclase (ATP)